MKLDQEFSLNQEETDNRIRGTAVDIAVFFMGVEINSASTGEMVGLIIDHHVQFPLEYNAILLLCTFVDKHGGRVMISRLKNPIEYLDAVQWRE